MHMITWEILMHFKGTNIHLCHGFLVDSYQSAPPSAHDHPITFPSQLKVDASDLRPPHHLVFHPAVLYSETDGKAKEKDGCCLTPSLFSLPFLSFNWKTQGAPPIPRQRQKKFLIFVVYLSTLVCWINHFTPVINKRTNGWMSLPSDYWFTNRQDVYFLRENYMEHFNFVDFLFVLFCWFLPLSPLPGFFARRGGFLWDCTDPHPTQHHRHHTQVQ